MKSKVYFANLRTTAAQGSLLDKMERLVRRAGIGQIDFKEQLTAIKIHFGEPGNLAYIRPNYAARMADILRSLGAKPFLTDANTLYKGGRSNAVDHLRSAMENGFNPISAKCDVVIADGLKGTEYREIVIDGEYCRAPKIGSAVADADIVVSMNHFKGHEASGFGGALKNLGMGCASRGGKLELHSSSQPAIDRDACTGCRICERNCAHDAVHVDGQRKAVIDYALCVGCGQCVALCQFEAAILAQWDTSESLNRKIAEYTKAVLLGKPHFHISFIMNVSPNCDCWGYNDAAIVPDLGIAASFDPVALDQACADIVTAATALYDNALSDRIMSGVTGSAGFGAGKGVGAPGVAAGQMAADFGNASAGLHIAHGGGHLEGQDKFRLTHPSTDWQSGLDHAEKIGVGTRSYELVTVK